MNRGARFAIAIIVLLSTSPLAHAGPCEDRIARVQARVDAAIEKRAAAGPWQRESLNATRSYQPTPQSIAAAEGRHGRKLQRALIALDLARAADQAGDVARCDAELKRARALIAY